MRWNKKGGGGLSGEKGDSPTFRGEIGKVFARAGQKESPKGRARPQHDNRAERGRD